MSQTSETKRQTNKWTPKRWIMAPQCSMNPAEPRGFERVERGFGTNTKTNSCLVVFLGESKPANQGNMVYLGCLPTVGWENSVCPWPHFQKPREDWQTGMSAYHKFAPRGWTPGPEGASGTPMASVHVGSSCCRVPIQIAGGPFGLPLKPIGSPGKRPQTVLWVFD